MKVIKHRYAYVTSDPAPQLPFEETLTFIVGGSEGVLPADPRLVDVDGLDVLLVSTSSPLYEVPTLPYTMTSVRCVNYTTGAIETVDVREAPILNSTYYNSSFWSPYSVPVKPELTEIDEDTYWTMMSAYYQPS